MPAPDKAHELLEKAQKTWLAANIARHYHYDFESRQCTLRSTPLNTDQLIKLLTRSKVGKKAGPRFNEVLTRLLANGPASEADSTSLTTILYKLVPHVPEDVVLRIIPRAPKHDTAPDDLVSLEHAAMENYPKAYEGYKEFVEALGPQARLHFCSDYAPAIGAILSCAQTQMADLTSPEIQRLRSLLEELASDKTRKGLH